jgi:hypothetical protein
MVRPLCSEVWRTACSEEGCGTSPAQRTRPGNRTVHQAFVKDGRSTSSSDNARTLPRSRVLGVGLEREEADKSDTFYRKKAG